MATLAAIMKFSMMSRRAVVNGDLEVDHLAAGDHRPGLDRLEIEEPVAAAEARSRWAASSCRPDLFLEAGHRGHFRGQGRSAFRATRPRRRRRAFARLWTSARCTSWRTTGSPGPTSISTTIAPRSSPGSTT